MPNIGVTSPSCFPLLMPLAVSLECQCISIIVEGKQQCVMIATTLNAGGSHAAPSPPRHLCFCVFWASSLPHAFQKMQAGRCEGSANPMCCWKYSIIAPPPPGVRSTMAGARLLPFPVTNMMRAPFLSTRSKGALSKAVCPSPDSIIENRVLRYLCLSFKYFATTAATTHTMARSEKRN